MFEKIFKIENTKNLFQINIFGIKIKKVKKNKNYNNYDKLTSREWGNLYNINMVNSLVNSVATQKYSVWTKELLTLIPNGSKTLEIGSGSGQSSLCLAMRGCDATILDFEQECLNLSKLAAERLNVNINTVCCDASNELPFKEKEFDYIFHCGLLEHFSEEEQIKLLKNWKKYCKTMISLVPNASSLAYRVGKRIMELNGTWVYGVENPLLTQIYIFQESGYKIVNEYSIGEEDSLNFLDKKDKLRIILEEYIKDGRIQKEFNQGYLLVTIGV